MSIHIEEKEIRGITVKTAIVVISSVVSIAAFVITTYFNILKRIDNGNDHDEEMLRLIKDANQGIQNIQSQVNTVRGDQDAMKIHQDRYDTYFKVRGWMDLDGTFKAEKIDSSWLNKYR